MDQTSGLVLDHLWDIAAGLVATDTAHRLVFDQAITVDTAAGMVVIVADMPSQFTATHIRSTVEVMAAISDAASSTGSPTFHVFSVWFW
jgi:hypothetical protein